MLSDPMQWSASDVKSWVMFTVQHYNLPMVPTEYFAMDGPALVALNEEEFNQRAPQVFPIPIFMIHEPLSVITFSTK